MYLAYRTRLDRRGLPGVSGRRPRRQHLAHPHRVNPLGQLAAHAQAFDQSAGRFWPCMREGPERTGGLMLQVHATSEDQLPNSKGKEGKLQQQQRTEKEGDGITKWIDACCISMPYCRLVWVLLIQD